jgi:hypothetical protein
MEFPFAVMLGGRHPKANIELHDLVFVMADSKDVAFKRAREKWFGSQERVHGDGYQELISVNGFNFSKENQENDYKLYAINMGGYRTGEFGEFHHFHFVVAENGKEAIKVARENTHSDFITAHVDDNLEVDDLIEVTEIGGNRLNWIPNAEARIPASNSGYFPFKKN